MRVKLLGSGAGGGVPQWNCGCSNCEQARSGAIAPRSQSSVAFSGDDSSWFLINASSDIRFQLGSLPRPSGGSARSGVFEGVFLSNADLDHTLGLLVVRENGPVTVYCSEDVWITVSNALGFDRILGAFTGGASPGIDWRSLESEPLDLATADGESTRLLVRTLKLGGSPPRFDPTAAGGNGHACAFMIEDTKSGARLVCALDVPERNAELLEAIAGANLTIFDGTFWSNREMIELGFSGRTATDMGHWPISGKDGSLAALISSGVSPVRLVYSHLNNTNPILDPCSPEAEIVQEAGIAIGADGMEWTI